MNILDKTRLLQTSVLSGLIMGFGLPAYAQQAPVEEIVELDEDFADSEDEVVVTGSRLRRDEFTSAAPLKVLNIDESIASGLVDVASIVQRTSVAGGTQFDNTFTGFVTDSGPGASTVSLRGLDAERTLVLSNGRRLAPAGVRGAPTRPDLNLIPLAALERVDVLTEGASSIYGSDAVAGVINFITKKDFDGIEADIFTSVTDAGGGSEFRGSLASGVSSDKGFFNMGIEFYKRDKVTRGQRDFTPCQRDIEVNPATGERREICQNGTFGNMFLDPLNALFGAGADGPGGLDSGFGIYGFDFDAGNGFALIPEDEQAGGPGLALGSTWLYDTRYNANLASDTFDLAQGTERYSFFSSGEYNIEKFGDATFYAEANYANRSQEIFAGANQIFPSVPCSNPFIQADPVLSQTPTCAAGAPFGPILDANSLRQLVFLPYLTNASGPINVDVTSTRGVMGVKGNLEDIIPTGKLRSGGENFGFDLGNFTYDFWVSYDKNVGIDRQQSLNEERTFASIATARLEGGEIVCGYSDPALSDDLFGFISPETCVPLDVTDPTLFLENRLPDNVVDYISGTDITSTTLEQSMVQGVISGDFAYLPAGTVPIALGFEYRKDEIETLNSFQITSGSGSGRLESDTIGSTSLFEVFGETSIPILKGLPLVEELTFDAAARYTDEKFFGKQWTYRLQGIYRPTDWLTSSVSFGTTYRAPNLREQNLAGQQSFAGAFTDPCTAASPTRNNLSPEELARLDANCVLQGADPTQLGLGGATSLPVSTGGTKALNPETSEGLTVRVVAEQPWFDDFDFSVAVGYYKIDIENSIEEPTSGFILSECLLESTNLDSPFCNLIRRDSNTADPTRNFISQIDASFVNVGLITTDGIDFDVRYGQEFAVGSDTLELDANMSASYVMSNKRDLFDTIESFDGRPNLPHWRGDMQASVGYKDLTLFWNGRYIGSTMDDDIDALRANDIVNENTGETFFFAGFRDVEETEAQTLHDFSLQYEQDTWTALIGVRNAFDKAPPLVDSAEGYSTSANAVLGGGYDVYGRSFFARINKRF